MLRAQRLYHVIIIHRLDDPWLIVFLFFVFFFMSSAFFAINAFCFNRDFLLALLQQNESADWKSSVHRDA